MIDKKQIITKIIGLTDEAKSKITQVKHLGSHLKTKEDMQKLANEDLDKIADFIDSWIDVRVNIILKGKAKSKKKKGSVPDIF
jgi:RNAse (barnase) inhibitor barstar